ncbi:hypothetical protein RA269_27695, partial [Pseudomonas syringae pv. tagetis]
VCCNMASSSADINATPNAPPSDRNKFDHHVWLWGGGWLCGGWCWLFCAGVVGRLCWFLWWAVCCFFCVLWCFLLLGGCVGLLWG